MHLLTKMCKNLQHQTPLALTWLLVYSGKLKWRVQVGLINEVNMAPKVSVSSCVHTHHLSCRKCALNIHHRELLPANVLQVR